MPMRHGPVDDEPLPDRFLLGGVGCRGADGERPDPGVGIGVAFQQGAPRRRSRLRVGPGGPEPANAGRCRGVIGLRCSQVTWSRSAERARPRSAGCRWGDARRASGRLLRRLAISAARSMSGPTARRSRRGLRYGSAAESEVSTAATAIRQRTASAAVASPVTSMSHTVATATPREMAVGSRGGAAKKAFPWSRVGSGHGEGEVIVVEQVEVRRGRKVDGSAGLVDLDLHERHAFQAAVRVGAVGADG